MNLNTFIQKYGSEIRMYKEYDNGVIMIKFDNPGKIMHLKKLVCEKLDMHVKMCNVGRAYWFEPNNWSHTHFSGIIPRVTHLNKQKVILINRSKKRNRIDQAYTYARKKWSHIHKYT